MPSIRGQRHRCGRCRQYGHHSTTCGRPPNGPTKSEIGECARSTLLLHVPRYGSARFAEIYAAFTNDYGSSTPRTVHRHLARLVADGAVVWRADEDGAREYRRT